MKKLLIVALGIAVSIVFISPGFAQVKETAKKAPTPNIRAVIPDVSGFVGRVAMINATMIAVKGKKEAVTFDARNPKLKGYKAIKDVLVGDTVAAKYTEDGIMITKLKGRVETKATAEKKAEKAKRAQKEKITAEERKAEKAKEAPREEVISFITCTKTEPCTVSVVKLTEGRAVIVGDHNLKVINKSKEGGSGTVTSTPSGITCSTGDPAGCEDFFAYNEEVTLSASADTGSTFIGWRPASKCPGTGDCTVTMNKKRTIMAVHQTINGKVINRNQIKGVE